VSPDPSHQGQVIVSERPPSPEMTDPVPRHGAHGALPAGSSLGEESSALTAREAT
jgi:hypothetical protein